MIALIKSLGSAALVIISKSLTQALDFGVGPHKGIDF